MTLKEKSVPVALYDVDAQKLVGVFATCALCSTYVWGAKKSITSYLKNKSRNKKNILNLHVCFRNATETQASKLGVDEFYLEDGYGDRTEVMKLNYKVRKQYGGCDNPGLKTRPSHLQEGDIKEIQRLYSMDIRPTLIAKRFRTSSQTINTHVKGLRLEKKLAAIPQELLLQELKNRGIQV